MLIVALLEAIMRKLFFSRVVRAINFLIEKRHFFRRVRHYLSDTKVHAGLTRVDRYDTEPTEDIDMTLFRDISDMSESVVFDAIDNDQNILRIRGDHLPTPLEIRIEPIQTFENGTPQINRHEVIVETYTDMAFGYSSSEPLDEFRTLSEDIAEAIQESCFDNATPVTTFLTGRIKGTLPTEKDRIEDEDIEMRAKVKDGKIQMTFKDPRYLTRGIRKYFEPV